MEVCEEASTTSIEVCGSFHDFHGSLWELVEVSAVINVYENLERFPVRSRAVRLVKSRVGLHHWLVSWYESLRSQANRASDVRVGSCTLIARRLLDTGEYQHIGGVARQLVQSPC